MILDISYPSCFVSVIGAKICTFVHLVYVQHSGRKSHFRIKIRFSFSLECRTTDYVRYLFIVYLHLFTILYFRQTLE